MEKSQHVVPVDGEWGVRGECNSSLTSIHETQAEAIEAAREIAINQLQRSSSTGATGAFVTKIATETIRFHRETRNID